MHFSRVYAIRIASVQGGKNIIHSFFLSVDALFLIGEIRSSLTTKIRAEYVGTLREYTIIKISIRTYVSRTSLLLVPTSITTTYLLRTRIISYYEYLPIVILLVIITIGRYHTPKMGTQILDYIVTLFLSPSPLFSPTHPCRARDNFRHFDRGAEGIAPRRLQRPKREQGRVQLRVQSCVAV